jgi:hypothetical protein
VLDNCSTPPNIVQEIVNDCNSRTIHFPIDHKNLNFHIVFLLSLAQTFADQSCTHIYTHSHSRTQIYSLHILTYTPFIYPTFNLRLYKAKKVEILVINLIVMALYHIICHESSPIKCNISRRQWKCIMYLSKVAHHISKR